VVGLVQFHPTINFGSPLLVSSLAPVSSLRFYISISCWCGAVLNLFASRSDVSVTAVGAVNGLAFLCEFRAFIIEAIWWILGHARKVFDKKCVRQ
jgi:hypothetical protein